MKKIILLGVLSVALLWANLAQAAPARLSQFGYADVYFRNTSGEANYIPEVSPFSNFFYLDSSNVFQPGLTDNQRQQKITDIISQARGRGQKVLLNLSYYFLVPDSSFKTRPAFRLADCFANGASCSRWQADAPLYKSLQADILAFQVSDRPNYYLVRLADQRQIIEKIHAAIPGTPVMNSYVLDGRLDADRKCAVTDFYNDVPLQWYYGPNRENCVAFDSSYGIPDNLDWLSLSVFNLGREDLVDKYWSEPIRQISTARPGKPVLPVVESFSDHLNHYGALMDDFTSLGVSKRRADSDTIGWYYDAAKTDLSGINILGFLYYSYGGLNIGQPTRGDGSTLEKEKAIFNAQSTLPVIKSFTADPAAVNPNISSVLHWEVTGAAQISIDPGISQVAIANTSRIVNPTETTAYTLYATNAYGTTTRTVTVTVIGSPQSSGSPAGNSNKSGYNDGSLVNDGGTIYVLENGTKRPIASMKVFNGWGYRLSNVARGDLSAIAAGQAVLHENQRHPRGALMVTSGTVYFLGSNLRYPFTSAAVFTSWGCQFKDVVSANQYDLQVPIGPPVEAKNP